MSIDAPGVEASQDAATLHQLGRAELERGESERALPLLTRALAAGPPQPLLALLDLGACLAKLKRWPESLSAALQAKALAPNDPAVASLAGHAYFALGRDQEALEQFARTLAQDARQASLWHLSSLSLLRLGRAEEAHANAERACALAPTRADYAAQRRAAAAAAVPDWHFNMVNDEPRNTAFAAAIAALVEPEQLVLELGTGAGLLAMLAAQDESGKPRARQVISCESNPLLARVAAEIVRENGLSERVQVIPKRSDALRIGTDLPKRADLLVCEIFSVQVLAEGVLPTIEDAKARLLEPGATVIPSAAVARAALVSGDALARRVRVGRVHGFDLSPLNAFSPIVQHVSSEQPFELLSAAFELFQFDFAGRDHFPSEKREFAVEASADGVCQGVIQWLRLELAPGIAYENRPGSPESEQSRHWQPVFYPFPAPVELRAGQRLSLRASHNRRGMHVELGTAEPG